MWDKQTYEMLIDQIPFDIEVTWDKVPSFQKYGYVNTLLVVISTLNRCDGIFIDEKGDRINSLIIQQLRRKLTDRKKRLFNIAGHETGKPILLSKLGPLLFEIYFWTAAIRSVDLQEFDVLTVERKDC